MGKKPTTVAERARILRVARYSKNLKKRMAIRKKYEVKISRAVKQRDKYAGKVQMLRRHRDSELKTLKK